MMVASPEPKYRTSTSQLQPFWLAHALYRHSIADPRIRAAEWDGLGLDDATICVLIRAGISCYRLISPCPDWLLLSVPGLGHTRLAAIRRILPYDRSIYSGAACPGARIETADLITWAARFGARGGV